MKRLTGGRGVDVVYDSVGKTTFDKSLNVLRPRGMMALFGQSSGSVPPFDPAILNARGSLFLTRPSLAHHLLDRKELLWRVGDVFGYVASGAVKVRISGTYPLSEAASAHRDAGRPKDDGEVVAEGWRLSASDQLHSQGSKLAEVHAELIPRRNRHGIDTRSCRDQSPAARPCP